MVYSWRCRLHGAGHPTTRGAKAPLRVQLTPRRSHREHHFAFHGATPRTADINDRDLQRKWSVDGYLTELDMRDPASAALTSRLIC